MSSSDKLEMLLTQLSEVGVFFFRGISEAFLFKTIFFLIMDILQYFCCIMRLNNKYLWILIKNYRVKGKLAMKGIILFLGVLVWGFLC